MKILLKIATMKKFEVLRNGHSMIGLLFWQKEESSIFPYLRAIQGHSGGIAIDPELQDTVLLPVGFTEYI